MAQLGRGIYSLPQAARLVGVPSRRLRRWVVGSPQGKSALPTPPEVLDGETSLEFVDLVSALFIRAFRDEGVPLQLIRSVAVEAASKLHNDRPFSLKRFTTDGRRIYEKHARSLIDAQTDQYVMRPIIDPLLRTIRYDLSGAAERWYPLGRRRPVVVDPRIAFGEPTVHGIPTRVLYGPVHAGDTPAEVARWYEVSESDVRAACEFETRMGSQKAA